MQQAQRSGSLTAIAPVSLATAAATGIAIDTLGFRYATFDIVLGAAAVNPTVLKLVEGPTTSPATDVAGFVGDTDFTIPAADAGGPQVVRFNVDLAKGNRQRYLMLALTTGATQLVAAICTLSKGDSELARAKNSAVVDG